MLLTRPAQGEPMLPAVFGIYTVGNAGKPWLRCGLPGVRPSTAFGLFLVFCAEYEAGNLAGR